MKKFKEFFKNPYNIFIIFIIILYVFFGIRSVYASESETESGTPSNSAESFIPMLPEFPSEIIGHDYILISTHGSLGIDYVTFYLYIFDDVTNITSEYMADTINFGTNPFYLQNVNGWRGWYKFEFGDVWKGAYTDNSIINIKNIDLIIHRCTFNVPLSSDSSVIAIKKNTNIILPDVEEESSSTEDWWNGGGSSSFNDWFGNVSNGLLDVRDTIVLGLLNLRDGLLNGLKDLFIPTFSPIWEIRTLIHDKLPALDQLLHIFGNVLGDTSEYAPTFSIVYKGNTYNIVDFSVFTPYRPILLIIQTALYWYLFIRWFIKFLPSMLSGIGGAFGK